MMRPRSVRTTALLGTLLAVACGGPNRSGPDGGSAPPGLDGALPRPGSDGTGGPGPVELLHFGTAGDTRPAGCEDTAGYPTAVINSIIDGVRAHGAQFFLDLGDHMYVCNGSLPVATAQMDLYMQALGRLGAPFYMTQGNHECGHTPCLQGSQDANHLAFMRALAPVSSKPFYRFDASTSKGLVTFVIVADNSWDSTQLAWLDQTLTDADEHATYTIVVRHHPASDTSVSTNSTVMQHIRAHKFALFLTGHSHLYKHGSTDAGRELVLGTGGAPLIAGAAFYGYAMVDQQADGQLQVSVYDLNSKAPVDVWSVAPNK